MQLFSSWFDAQNNTDLKLGEGQILNTFWILPGEILE